MLQIDAGKKAQKEGTEIMGSIILICSHGLFLNYVIILETAYCGTRIDYNCLLQAILSNKLDEYSGFRV